MKTTLTRLPVLIATLALALFANAASSIGAPASQPLTITSLVSNIDANVGKQIVIEGMATWVCPHRGCKAQLIDANGGSKTALVVTQGKDMPKFLPELRGDTLRVTGVLHEKRITAADLDEQEKEIKNPPAAAHNHADGHDHGKGGDDCADCPEKQQPADPAQLAKARETQLARIASHRAMLAKSKKGYLSALTFEGRSWAKIE